MQVIIAPAGGENWLIPDLTAETPVSTLRGIVASKLGSEPSATKLVCDGHELVDGATLRDFYVSNLSTVRVAVVGAPQPAPAAAGLAADEVSAGSLVSDEEMPRSVVVRGVPAADPATTEKAIFDAFSRFGEIARLVFQDEAAAAPAAQRAVIVFFRDSSAAASLAADGTPLLGGGPLRVTLASSLVARPAAGSAGTGAAAVPVKFLAPSAAVVELLAQGFLYGHEGVAHVKAYDERAGLTRRVKVWADAADARLHVSATVLSAYAVAAAQAQQLERAWKAFDNAHHLHERVEAGFMAAVDRAQALGSTVMRDPTIARAVHATHDLVRESIMAIHDTVQLAQDKAAQRFAQGASAQQQPGAAAAAVAEAGAAAAPAGAPATAEQAAAALAPAAAVIPAPPIVAVAAPGSTEGASGAPPSGK